MYYNNPKRLSLGRHERMNMLPRLIPVFISICLLCGCGQKDEKPAAIKIDNIRITSGEYSEAFRNSPYASSDTPEARKEFLDNFITRMLILREAERTGMDKDPEFLKNVQFFWQQSLIKMVLDSKIKELASHVRVAESEVKNYYDANKDTEFKGQEMSAVYDRIKWMILNQKQKALMDDWVNSLKAESKITVNNDLLKTGE